MIAEHGIYDGKSVKLLGKLPGKKKYNVIVTFVEELESTDTSLRKFSAQTQGLDFWKDPREDVYRDYKKFLRIKK